MDTKKNELNYRPGTSVCYRRTNFFRPAIAEALWGQFAFEKPVDNGESFDRIIKIRLR